MFLSVPFFTALMSRWESQGCGDSEWIGLGFAGGEETRALSEALRASAVNELPTATA